MLQYCRKKGRIAAAACRITSAHPGCFLFASEKFRRPGHFSFPLGGIRAPPDTRLLGAHLSQNLKPHLNRFSRFRKARDRANRPTYTQTDSHATPPVQEQTASTLYMRCGLIITRQLAADSKLRPRPHLGRFGDTLADRQTDRQTDTQTQEHTDTRARHNKEPKCADTTGTALVPWAGRFQCRNINIVFT